MPAQGEAVFGGERDRAGVTDAAVVVVVGLLVSGGARWAGPVVAGTRPWWPARRQWCWTVAPGSVTRRRSLLASAAKRDQRTRSEAAETPGEGRLASRSILHPLLLSVVVDRNIARPTAGHEQ